MSKNTQNYKQGTLGEFSYVIKKDYKQVIKEVHELAKADNNAMALLLLHIINEILLDNNKTEKTFEDLDRWHESHKKTFDEYGYLVHDEILYAKDGMLKGLEDEIKTLEEKITKLEEAD